MKHLRAFLSFRYAPIFRYIGKSVAKLIVGETSRAMDEAVRTGSRRRPGGDHESQLFIHYRSSGWVQVDLPAGQDNQEAPRAGDRAPDAFGLGRPIVAHRSRLRERLERGKASSIAN